MSEVFLLASAAAANLMALPVIDANAVKPDFKAAFNEGGAAATEVRLTISPSGITVRCEHGFLNGPRQNAEAFCAMLKRVQFAPAKDDVGKAAYAVVYVWSRWSNRRWMGSDFPSWDPVNLGLATNKMPKGFADGSMFELVLEADSKGSITSCKAAAADITNDVANLLCREASAEPITPARNEDGTAVPSIQQFIVRLTSKAALDKAMKKALAH